MKRGARNQINRYRTYDVYHARVQDCAACPLRSRCLSKSTTSRRSLSVQVGTQPNLIDEMKAKIDTQQGKQIYARRLGIVEPVFANICVQKHMNRFTLRTKFQGGCTMGVVRSGTQYRQDPRVRGVDISLV